MSSASEVSPPFPLFANSTVIPGFGLGAGKFYRFPDGKRTNKVFFVAVADLLFFFTATFKSEALTEILDIGSY